MAPEITRNGEYTTKVDIWALGVILFQCVHRLPSLKFILAGQTQQVIYDMVSVVEDPSIRYLLSFMLQIDPIDRPDINQLFYNPIVQGWCNLLYDSKNLNHKHH